MALPGVRTTILDRFYNLSRTDIPGGPLIAVIAKRTAAESTTSPNYSAYYPSSEADVINQFGEDSYLHRAYYELTTSGAARVVLVPLPSDTAFNHTNGTLSSASSNGVAVLDAAFAACESARADIIVPWGRGSDSTDWDDSATPATPGGTYDYFYADNSTDTSKSWVAKIAAKCAELTLNSYPVFAVMGIKGLAGIENPTPSQVSTGIALRNLVAKNAVVSGNLVSVVASEMHLLSAPDAWGWSNGACAYAALISRLDSWSATTGKPLYNVDKVRFDLTRTQAEALITKGIVPIQLDFSRSARWVDGITFAADSSDYSRLSSLRIIFDAVKLVRTIAQNYVGEGMSLQMRNAFETQLSSALRSMQQVGAVMSSDFRVQYSPADNKAYVDLAITPAFELREVIVSVSVNMQ
jgi:hypothetical protein